MCYLTCSLHCKLVAARAIESARRNCSPWRRLRRCWHIAGSKQIRWGQLKFHVISIMELRQVSRPKLLQHRRRRFFIRFSNIISYILPAARSIGNFPIGVGKYNWDRSIIKALGEDLIRQRFLPKSSY